MGDDFYTFREYIRKDDKSLTPSMEDYLEMIYRLAQNTGYVRIHDLAAALNVQPPSVTKMVQRLNELELINYERYGIIHMKEKGKELGIGLLKRHNILEEFLKLIGVGDSALEETEKIEHTISNETLDCINVLLKFLKLRPEIMDDLKIYKQELQNEE